jgi:hypothetical protein
MAQWRAGMAGAYGDDCFREASERRHREGVEGAARDAFLPLAGARLHMRHHLLSLTAWLLVIGFAIGSLVSSCVPPGEAPSATATPTPMAPTSATTAPIPASTPVQALPPTATPGEESADGVITLAKAGVTFRPASGFTPRVTWWQAVMSDPEEKVVFSLSGAANPRGLSIEDELGIYLNAFGITTTAVSKVSPILVDGIEGRAIDIEGHKLYGETATGRVIIIEPDPSRVFVASGFAADGAERDGWEKKGRKPFEAIVDSVRFFEPSE